jgi:hypothetical protein
MCQPTTVSKMNCQNPRARTARTWRNKRAAQFEALASHGTGTRTSHMLWPARSDHAPLPRRTWLQSFHTCWPGISTPPPRSRLDAIRCQKEPRPTSARSFRRARWTRWISSTSVRPLTSRQSSRAAALDVSCSRPTTTRKMPQEPCSHRLARKLQCRYRALRMTGLSLVGSFSQIEPLSPLALFGSPHLIVP